MFAEGESELRDLVVQNLESCGFLNKIKAELRAGVFLALSTEGSLKKKVPLCNKKLDDFLKTNDGKLTLSLVREFLEYFNLNFTLSVFNPEVSSSSPYASRESLCLDLNLNESEVEGPILSALFKRQFMELNLSNEKNEAEEKNSGNDNIKEKITQGSIDSVKDLFDEKGETVLEETNQNNKSVDISSFSINKASNSRNFFNFNKPEEKDVFKDQSIDNFFDNPVPTEKPTFLNLGSTNSLNNETTLSSPFLTSDKGSASAINDQKNLSSYLTSEKESFTDHKTISSSFLTPAKESINALDGKKKITSIFLSSEKGSLSSLRDLPSLTKQDKNKESLSIALESSRIDEDLSKKDPESNEEFSDKQINSEESIEEDIEEEFSTGLDDLLNSSLSLGDDATSDQTVSQASVVDGVDHIEICNTVN